MSCKKLFVGNIPYSTTDGDLEKAFNDHGEVKACFTVKEPGQYTALGPVNTSCVG